MSNEIARERLPGRRPDAATWLVLMLAGALAGAGCQPTTPPQQQDVDDDPIPDLGPPAAPPGEQSDEPEMDEDTEAEDEGTETGEESAEPAFEPGMSVQDAMNAVPSSADRLNIEQERLAEPLTEPELYEPCELAPSQHFTVQVAVWDGRAVGMDIETKPKNENVEQCLREQIGGIEWEDKVDSLNTVQYSY